jgi:hypothetical protein
MSNAMGEGGFSEVENFVGEVENFVKILTSNVDGSLLNVENVHI